MTNFFIQNINNDEDILTRLNNPLIFNRKGSIEKPKINWYDATLLVDVCDWLIQAKNDGELKTEIELNMVKQAEIIIRAVAKIGIVALVDEATWYENVRVKDALQKIFEKL